MSEKTDRIEQEIVDFLAEQKRREDLNEGHLMEVSRWATYASRQRGELGTQAAIGALSPAEYEQRLNALADEVIGQVGAVTMPEKVRKMAEMAKIEPAEYARRLYRGRRR